MTSRYYRTLRASRAAARRSAFQTSAFCRTALGSVALVVVSTLASGNPASIERVETTNAVLSFKKGSGDLIGLEWKHPKLDVIREAKLGENFRILLPRPDYEASYFKSRDQVLRKLEQSPNCVVLHYGPLRNDREEVNVKVAYEIRDTGSQLQFSIQVENATDRPLAEVFYGVIGGQQGVGDRLGTETLIPTGYPNAASKMFSQYPGNWYKSGSPYNFIGYSYPGSMAMGWMDVYNAKEGVGYYYANQDPEIRITTLYTEMRPYATHLKPDNWPNPAELPAGEPIGVTMGWVNYPYTKNGTFRAGPIALQVHKGDWHDASALYRSWFDRHFQVAREPDWLRKEMAWQSVIMLDADDQVLFRFKDLPRLV